MPTCLLLPKSGRLLVVTAEVVAGGGKQGRAVALTIPKDRKNVTILSPYVQLGA